MNKEYIHHIVSGKGYTKEEAAIDFMDKFMELAKPGECFLRREPSYKVYRAYNTQKDIHEYGMRISFSNDLVEQKSPHEIKEGLVWIKNT